MLTVRIGTWVNGSPVTVRTFPVETKDEGVQALRNIGHSWDYNIDYAGWLEDAEGNKLATLTILQHTYGVKEH